MVNDKMISYLHTQLLAADQPLAALQALGLAVVRRQRVQGLHFRRCEEGVMVPQWLKLAFGVKRALAVLLAFEKTEAQAR